MPISLEVIKALSQQLHREEEIGVKETIVSAIGTIGKPDAQIQIALDSLIKVYNKSNSSKEATLKSMIVWTIGRLASVEVGRKVQKMLLDALEDQYWKVRAAACTAIANFREQMADKGIPILMRLLKDGTQSKQLVAETIVALGPHGETQLIALLKQHHSQNRLLTNSKAKEFIVKALAQSNIENPNIDFVIETLFFSYSRETDPNVRKAALIALDILHRRSKQLQQEQTAINSYETQDDNVSNASKNRNAWASSTNQYATISGHQGLRAHFNTYLQPGNLLPFFYQCLRDKSQAVRECAIVCIKNFGAHGELMFIEGISKEHIPQIRAECASGLG